MKGLYSTGATDLRDIFLAPLEAVITADIDLSRKITHFIAHYGFEKNPGGAAEKEEHFGHLKMVSFSFLNERGKRQVCSLPVLSLIQLPLLCIKDADFDMRVKMITTDEKVDPGPPSLTDAVTTPAVPPKKVSLKGYLSPDTEKISDTMKANMKVKLRMGQSDMPGGLIKILSLMDEITELKKADHE